MARSARTEPEPTSFLRRKQVEARTGLSRSTLYARIQQKQFPEPINLGGRAVGWLKSEIDAWADLQVRQSPELRRDHIE